MPRVPEGERRQITILFCDLVDSVSLSTRLDPEDFGRLMQRYEAVGQHAVEEFGGHIAQYLGDGLVVYFGYPQAHERAAEMAVRAGLALLANVARLDAENAESLAVRIGIHTGEVVVQAMGRGDRREPLALGDVVNIAARAQSLAEPGSVAITGATLQLVEGIFALDSLGYPNIKGVSKPLELLRVIGAKEDRAAYFAHRRRSRFVGRRDEFAVLATCWARARRGDGQIVQITGEPGIGKSRLVDEFRQVLVDDDHIWLECGGMPHRQHTPFATLAQMTSQAFGWKPEDPSPDRLDELDAGLAAAGLDPSRVTPLLAPVLGLTPERGRYPVELRSAGQQREDLQRAMVQWLLAVARDRPLVVLTEDLHWLDPSSLELLDRMGSAIVSAPVLMLHTARPEYEPSLAMAGHASCLVLAPLGRDDVNELVSELAGAEGATADLAKVAERAGGVPLFLEEVLRNASEETPDAIATVPPTLRDALAARLDRLGEAKSIAQAASVLGVEFSSGMLADVADVDAETLRSRLGELSAHDITRAIGRDEAAIHRFTHALLQETAYASLLRARRQELHGRVADALSARQPAIVARRPELLAHHLAGAGRIAEAVDEWDRAFTRAFAASALVEAEAHVEAAIRLLAQLPDDATRVSTEVRLQMQLGRVCSATHGTASARTRASYARAMELGASLDDRPQLMGLLLGAWAGAFSHGEIAEAEWHLGELVREFAASDDRSMTGWVCYAEAATVFARGDLDRADRLLDRIFVAGRPSGDLPQIGLDVSSTALTHRALIAWNLGRVREAIALVDAHLAETDPTAPWQLAMVLMASCCLFIRLRNVQRVRSDAARLRAVAEESALPTCIAWADLYLGWALAQEGAFDEGLVLMRTGLAAYLATDQRTGHPGYLTWIAAAQLGGGDPAGALDTIRHAANALPEEIIDVSSIWRVHGQILEADPTLAESGETAAHCYEQAITAARQLGSVMLELEATTQLVRLLRGADDRHVERVSVAQLLERVVGGDEIPDVLEAREVAKDT